MEGHVVEVEIPPHRLWLLSAWSRYDSQRPHVLWGMVFSPRLLLVTVVDVLGLHGFFHCEDRKGFRSVSIFLEPLNFLYLFYEVDKKI